VGCDTSAKLTRAVAQGLAAATWAGQPLRFVFRYVPIVDGPAPGDIDAGERAAILDAGLWLGLVQHVCDRSWVASVGTGNGDGQRAAAAAQAAGYLAGAHLALDLEGCASVGPVVAAYVEAWAAVVLAEGFTPLLYVGYAAGLSATQLYQWLPSVKAYWSDYGPRAVDPRGFVCKQSAQVQIAGVLVDPDRASADRLGGRLLLMGS
jgi:Rv2525c-like, glycoside hydrolase-like domain